MPRLRNMPGDARHPRVLTLLRLVLAGRKRATSSSLTGYTLEGERPPARAT